MPVIIEAGKITTVGIGLSLIAPPEVYSCPYCGATFSTGAERDAHIVAVHRPEPEVYTCSLCGATFSTAGELDTHMAVAHPPPPAMVCTPGETRRGEYAWFWTIEQCNQFGSGWVEIERHYY